MKINHLLTLLVSCLLYNVACAESSAVVLEKYDCVVCHNQAGKRKLGPSFKMIADRYAGNPDAVAYLVGKVRNGGPGGWGPIPMPAAPANASDAEITQMVKAILSTK